MEAFRQHRERRSFALFDFMSKFCLIDLYPNKYGRDRKKLHAFPLWSKIVIFLYLVALVYIAMFTFFQYLYDHGQTKLKSLQQRNITTTQKFSVNDLVANIQQLESNIRHNQKILYYIGVPPFRIPYIIQIISLFGMIVSITMYLSGVLLFNYIRTYDAYLLRSLFQSEFEDNINSDLILRQIDSYIYSDNSIQPQGISIQTSAHYRSIHLRSYIATGSLDPYKSDFHLKRKQWDVLNLLSLYTINFMVQYDIGFFIAILFILDLNEIRLNFLYAIFIINIILFTAINSLSSAFYFSIQTFLSIDLIRASARLRTEFLECIQVNTKLHTQLQDDSSSIINKSIINKMNAHLFAAIVRYQIFLIQTRRLTSCLSFVSTNSKIILFLLPILGRLHIPYFDPTKEKVIRLIIAAGSVCFLVPVNVALLPLCIMQSNLYKLYKTIYLILAHIAHVQEKTKSHLIVYDDRLIKILYKELDRPKGITHQYGPSFVLMNYSYSSLLRLHFYFGFIVLLILFESRSKNSKQGETSGILGKVFSISQ